MNKIIQIARSLLCQTARPGPVREFLSRRFYILLSRLFILSFITLQWSQSALGEEPSTAVKPAKKEEPAAAGEADESKGLGKSAGIAVKKAAKKAVPIVGPMPWNYGGLWSLKLGLLTGKYSDTQENITIKHSGGLSDIVTKGYRLEAEIFGAKYWRLAAEARLETPAHELWTKRSTYIGSLGWVLPWLPMTVLSLGIHSEFNSFEYEHQKSPDITKLDLVAPYVGLDLRQAIIRKQTFSLNVPISYHLVNFQDRPNQLTEIEAGLGVGLLLGKSKMDLSATMLRQQFQARHDVTEDDPYEYTIAGQSTSTSIRVGVWF